jgi:uncharacterized membrane protein YobD (UPF0266 family)
MVAAVVTFVSAALTILFTLAVYDCIEARWLAPVYLVSGVVMTALGVVSGVGLVKRRKWGWKGAIIFIVLGFVLGTLLRTEFGVCTWEPVFDQRGFWFAKVFMDWIHFHVLALLWRVPYVIYLTRSKVKAQFK